MAAGERYGIAPGCVSHARRIESGILSWGIDMTPEENPFEVGLGRLVDLDVTPDFIGKEALVRLKSAPLRRRLVGLEVSGDPLASNEDAWPVTAGGAKVGKLTSIAHSPRLERNIALGILDVEFSAPDTEVTVETWDGPRAARVRQLPFVEKTQNLDARQLRRNPELGLAP